MANLAAAHRSASSHRHAQPESTPEKEFEPRRLTAHRQLVHWTTHTEGDVIEVHEGRTPPQTVIASLDGLVTLTGYENAEEVCRDAKVGQHFLSDSAEKNNDQEYDLYKNRLKDPRYNADRD